MIDETYGVAVQFDEEEEEVCTLIETVSCLVEIIKAAFSVFSLSLSSVGNGKFLTGIF